MGKIVELPCDIGDHIYEIIITRDEEVYFCIYKIQDVSIKAIRYEDIWIDRSEIGINVFLNKEEAESVFNKLRRSDEYKSYRFFDEYDNEV